MPGPVSDSNPGPGTTPASFATAWQRVTRETGIRYFVLKAKDVFAALDPEEVAHLNAIMFTINSYRVEQGKEEGRDFWVYARHWPGADEFKNLMEQKFGHPVGNPY